MNKLVHPCPLRLGRASYAGPGRRRQERYPRLPAPPVDGAVRRLSEVPTTGVLIFGSADDPAVVEAAERLRLPIVPIDDSAESVLLPPALLTDSRGGARLGVEHLLAQGRRNIANVGGAYTAWYMTERLLGYRAPLDRASISFDPSLVVRCANTEDEARHGYPEFDRFLRTHPDIDGIFCEADDIAAPVLRSLRASGLSVPDDVSLVGFDDE